MPNEKQKNPYHDGETPKEKIVESFHVFVALSDYISFSKTAYIKFYSATNDRSLFQETQTEKHPNTKPTADPSWFAVDYSSAQRDTFT